MAKDESIRVCPKCGSVNLKNNPREWEVKPNDVVVSLCMLCNHKGKDFPVIKKTVLKQFKDRLKKQ